MDENHVIELKYSLKEIIKNLIKRIPDVIVKIEGNQTDSLYYWLEDFTTMTEAVVVLKESNMIDIDLNLFNEKALQLLEKAEEQDFFFVADFLKYEIEPILTYWDGCITND